MTKQTKFVYNKEENYCSFSPEELFGVRFNHACFIHDRQYRDEVVNRKSRLEADVFMREGIYNDFAKADKKVIGFFVAWLYYLAVRLFGGGYWANKKDMRA